MQGIACAVVVIYLQNVKDYIPDFIVPERMEGIMLKNRESCYYSGKRSQAWLKHKPNQTIDAVVLGYNKGEGERESTFGSLRLGVRERGRLKHIGDVGSGFDKKELEEIKAKIDRGEKLVVEVKHLCWSKKGKLRHPVFLRLRDDKNV